MTLEQIRRILNCEVLNGNESLDLEVTSGCGADLMSDVLAFARPGTILLTGLTNVQAVRTADVADIRAIVFVRGKLPDRETIELAKARGIPLLATRLTMFEACGRLWAAGLRGDSDSEAAQDAGGVHLHTAV
ncbi:MAG: DRTGG domain-containing protein [Bryobacterales bacterium]|nr:DRTGG domain-containing protein [Bryobacteraceae bacterium]MDW8129506.1 DRTGG domain-containing protein [Bryobacterales bacterium]